MSHIDASSNNLGRSQPSTKLKSLKIILAKKFSCLSIHQTISRYGVPFLHIWKPISRSEGVQGMEFLPCFHLIVTITNEHANIQIDHNNDSVLFQLHSFHGKVLAEELQVFEQCNNSTFYDLISRMATDRLHLCHGIDDLHTEQFMDFIQTCTLPLFNKLKSIFLIEQLMGTILVRSRLCKFVLYDDGSTEGEAKDEDNSLKCCEECQSFQIERENVKDNAYNIRENGCDTENKVQNIFHKVCSQTSNLDLQSLVVIQKVNEIPNDSEFESTVNTHFKHEKQQINLLNDSFNANVKEEPPCDQLNLQINNSNEQSAASNQNIRRNEPPLYQNALDYSTNDDEANDMFLNPPLDINDPNFYVEDDLHFGLDNNLDINNGYDNLDEEYSKSQDQTIRQNAKRKRRVKTDIQAEHYEPQYKILLKDRMERKRARLDKKRVMLKERQSKRQIQKEKRVEKLRDGDLKDGKKEFRRTCLICLYEFQSECNFNTDQLRHQQAFEDMEQPVVCPLCHERVETKYMITTHFEERHSNQNVTCCCECLEVIPKGSNRLRRHILKCHHSATEKQVCPECGQECAGNAKLEIHMAETHSDKKAAVCEECGKTFGHLKVYKQHLRRHHNPRDLQCLQCDKKFEHRQQAIDHLVVHTGIKPYKCVQCNYVSYRISNVICIHFLKCHGRKGISATDLSTDIIERDRMMEIARAGVQEMVKIRDLKLKKEVDS